MRVLRLILAVLLATTLLALPITASLAKALAANAEMAMGASGDADDANDDCPCCPATGKCFASICAVTCFNVPGILLDAPLAAEPLPGLFAGTAEARLSPFSRPPDPPPPRF